VRLFVAITPPEQVLGELAVAVAPLRAARPELRWTGQDDWHLTLAFLGEVPETVMPQLTTRLQRAAWRHHAQLLAVRGAGAFPKPARASVLWAGIHAGPGLAPLAASVAAAARRAGAPPPNEDRRFRPHLTLARARQHPADMRALTEVLASYAGHPWTAADIQLIRSNLAARSPQSRRSRYEELGSWPMRKPDQSGI
jgi:RNA 2',3'-cyclic 3'-phosphodiesterase